jgi:hypothetical protein
VGPRTDIKVKVGPRTDIKVKVGQGQISRSRWAKDRYQGQGGPRTDIKVKVGQ